MGIATREKTPVSPRTNIFFNILCSKFYIYVTLNIELLNIYKNTTGINFVRGTISWQIFEKPFNAVPSVSFVRSKLINLSTVAVVSIVAIREDDNAFPAGGGKQEVEDQRERDIGGGGGE